MGIEVEWDSTARSAIVVRYREQYTWDDIDALEQQVHAMMQSVPHRVDMIVVRSVKVGPPKGRNVLAQMRRTFDRMPANFGTYVNVGRGSAFSQSLINVMLKVFPIPYEIAVAGSEEEARALLTKRRVKDYEEVGTKAPLGGAVTLHPLTEGQMQAYLRAAGLDALWDALAGDAALREVARTPLLLSFFADAYRDNQRDLDALRDLAHSPGDLRDRVFETYVNGRCAHEARRAKRRGETLP